FSAGREADAETHTFDERVALGLGLLGQETIGPGGLAYALRTLPVALDIARTVAEVAPGAWVINFTNPAGIVTEAMRTVLGDRVDRKSTRLNSSHVSISYAVFCLKKKKKKSSANR